MLEGKIDVQKVAIDARQLLQERVRVACTSRRKEHYVPEKDVTQEMYEEHQELHERVSKKDDNEIMNFGVYISAPYQVTTPDSHEYLELLKLAVKAARPQWASDDVYVEVEAIQRFEHEMDHAAPLIGHDDSGVLYGVHFYEDAESGEINFIPMIVMQGKIPVGRVKDAISNVDTMSEGDVIIV